MMKNKMAGWIIGGLITAATLGVAWGANSIGSAAAKSEQATISSGMMQNGQMSTDMMNSPEMQQECQKMMASPEMQQTMRDMMKQPEMQNMMRKMMASDPAFKQTMSDMVNNADTAATNEQEPSNSRESIDHNAHHLSK